MDEATVWPREVVEAWVADSCADQGVPVKITDPLLLRQVGALLGASSPSALSVTGSAAERQGTPGGSRVGARAAGRARAHASERAVQPPRRADPYSRQTG